MQKLKGINLAIAILSSILILTLGFGYIKVNNNKIAKNTYIKDVNIGNLRKEQAKNKIQKEFKIDIITFMYDDKKWNINPRDIKLNYDIDKTVDDAYNINRNKNIFSNIINTLKSIVGNKQYINIYVDYDKEKVISELDKISKEVNVDMENAKLNIVGNNIEVTKEKSGLVIDINNTLTSLKKSLQEGIFEESLVVTKIEPDVKKENLQDVNTLIGSYTTILRDISLGRIENIKIATERTSGVLLMPGEEFSYNKHTGLRTVENGYKNATVIVSGEAVQGVGGGVCQVSTTLYNAVLYAGLDIVKVTNHSIPSSYVGKGRDAVVSDSGLDFVFKNNYNHPIYIKNYYNNGTITCQVYGNNKDKQNIEISTTIDKVGKAPIKKQYDSTLTQGIERILELGRDSYSVSTYRIYYDDNGKKMKTEKVATSFYPSKQQVVVVGTKEEIFDLLEDEPNKEEINNSDNSNIDNNENNNGNDSINNNTDDNINNSDDIIN